MGQAHRRTGGGFPWPRWALSKHWRNGDIALALGVMAIIVVLIVPMPPSCSTSAGDLDHLSVLILMTALLIQKPLEFSAFPTVLLLATLLRLALNLASTRLILATATKAPDAAGTSSRPSATS
jgi:flagellar biosynthesis protein FlhA